MNARVKAPKKAKAIRSVKATQQPKAFALVIALSKFVRWHCSRVTSGDTRNTHTDTTALFQAESEKTVTGIVSTLTIDDKRYRLFSRVAGNLVLTECVSSFGGGLCIHPLQARPIGMLVNADSQYIMPVFGRCKIGMMRYVELLQDMPQLLDMPKPVSRLDTPVVALSASNIFGKSTEVYLSPRFYDCLQAAKGKAKECKMPISITIDYNKSCIQCGSLRYAMPHSAEKHVTEPPKPKARQLTKTEKLEKLELLAVLQHASVIDENAFDARLRQLARKLSPTELLQQLRREAALITPEHIATADMVRRQQQTKA